MTTTPVDVPDISWNYDQVRQDAEERAAAGADLRAWEHLDREYDAREAGRFERHLDRLFGLDGAR